MNLSNLAEELSKSTGVFAGGLFGAILSLRFVSEDRSNFSRLVMVLGGTVTAVYATPLIVHFFNMTGNFENGISFFVGLYGMSLIDALYSSIKDGTLIATIKQKVGL